ncbi:hypothetical protein M0R45_028806 [Rubus argutus]|uniref:Uncharacterized protein n=1 Tax=Rubus argutus TaxID=59490 RepID=A0AAW1W8U5_RUBAR
MCLPGAVGGGADLLRNGHSTFAGKTSCKVRVESGDATSHVFEAIAGGLAVSGGLGCGNREGGDPSFSCFLLFLSRLRLHFESTPPPALKSVTNTPSQAACAASNPPQQQLTHNRHGSSFDPHQLHLQNHHGVQPPWTPTSALSNLQAQSLKSTMAAILISTPIDGHPSAEASRPATTHHLCRAQLTGVALPSRSIHRSTCCRASPTQRSLLLLDLGNSRARAPLLRRQLPSTPEIPVELLMTPSPLLAMSSLPPLAPSSPHLYRS